MLAQLANAATADNQQVFYNLTFIGLSGILGGIWIYMQKQFSAITKRSDASEKMAADFRVSVEGRFATLAQQISSLPADTALQIAESYERGSKAAREAFVPTAQCAQREKEVDRRLDGIDSVARTAAQHAERANYRIENLENPR
jgi:hypothetical protein